MFRLAVFAGLVVYAAAQSLSQTCQTALGNIAGNKDANQCLALTTLYSVVTTPADKSIVQPLNTWLGAMCSAPSCTNITLAAVVTNLTAGCSSEFNIPSDATSLIPKVQSLYPTVRKFLCLKQGDSFCITDTLTRLEAITGTLTLENARKVANSPPTPLPANITCTDCNKEAYNIWVKDFPSTPKPTCG